MICVGCAEERPESDFYTGRKTCRACYADKNREAYARRNGAIPEAQMCIGCTLILPSSAFHRRGRAGLQSRCIKCRSAQRRAAHDPTGRLRRYGLTVERYMDMLEDQGHACAICGSPEPGGTGAWCIDHDHACCDGVGSCGECVRGLLCSQCNSGLGMFRDSIENLVSAIEYLRA